MVGGRDIRLDGLAEADRQLLGGIGRDALRRIRHERIGEADGQHLVQELLRVDNARIDNEGHALLVAHAGDEAGKLLVLHLGRDGLVAEDAAVNRKAGVQRVQTGADLHFLDLVYDVAGRDDDAGLFDGGGRSGSCPQ